MAQDLLSRLLPARGSRPQAADPANHSDAGIWQRGHRLYVTYGAEPELAELRWEPSLPRASWHRRPASSPPAHHLKRARSKCGRALALPCPRAPRRDWRGRVRGQLPSMPLGHAEAPIGVTASDRERGPGGSASRDRLASLLISCYPHCRLPLSTGGDPASRAVVPSTSWLSPSSPGSPAAPTRPAP